MDKFVENLKKSVNKSNKTEDAEQENSVQYDKSDCLGLSRLKSYRNVLRFSAVRRKDPKVRSYSRNLSCMDSSIPNTFITKNIYRKAQIKL